MRALNQPEFASTRRDHSQTFASSTTASLATTLATSSNQTCLPSVSNHLRGAPVSANTPTESTTTHSFPQSNTPDAIPVRATPSSTEYIFDNLPAPQPSSATAPSFSESLELNLMPPHPLPSHPTSSLPQSHTQSQHYPQSHSYSQALFHPSSYIPSVESSRTGPVLPTASSNVAQSHPSWHVPPLSTNPAVSPHHHSSDAPFLPSPHQHALPPTVQLVSPHSHQQQSRVPGPQSIPPFRATMGDTLAQLSSPREGQSYAHNNTDMSGPNIRPASMQGSAIGMSMSGLPHSSHNASGPGSAAVHFEGRLPPPHIQYTEDDGSEPRIDTRKGKERVMRRCVCGHFNHIRKNNCEKCDQPKQPPRKREKRPRRKKRSFLSTTGMAALSQSFGGPFVSYGSSHQQFMQPHLQSPVQQQHVPSQHTQFGQSQTPSYLPQITPLAQHRTQQHEYGIDRQDGPSSLIQEPEPTDIFRRNNQDYPTALDASAIPGLSNVHTTHSLSGPVSTPGFGRDEVGATSSGFALTHSGEMQSSGHSLGPTADNAGQDGNSQSASPNMGRSIYQRMHNQALSMEDIHHRPVHEQMRLHQGLAHTTLSTPPSDGPNISNRDASLGGPLDMRSSGPLGQGHSSVFAHGQTQHRYPFSTQVLHSGAGGTSDGSHVLGADMQPFQHTVLLPAVAEQQKMGVATSRHEARPGADSPHGGRHSR